MENNYQSIGNIISSNLAKVNTYKEQPSTYQTYKRTILKWNIILLYISTIVSLSMSIIALCRQYPSSLSFDYSGIIVAIFSFLVTILIGWNIWTVIDVKQEWRENKEYTERLESELNEAKERLGKEQNTIRHYGYAITDFCQVYVKLEPERKNYWATYCKALSALKNFLHTKEDLNWYAPACINNMEEALRRAQESNEICSEEINNDIRTYLSEIRTCSIESFSSYWKDIEELESRRNG